MTRAQAVVSAIAGWAVWTLATYLLEARRCFATGIGAGWATSRVSSRRSHRSASGCSRKAIGKRTVGVELAIAVT